MRVYAMPQKISPNSSPSRRTLSGLKSYLKHKTHCMVKCLKTFLDGSIISNDKDVFSLLERRVWVLLAAIAIFVFMLALSGCSATTEISKATTKIAESAASSKDRFTLIRDETTNPSPNINVIEDEAVAGIKEQESILSYTSNIQHKLPSVEDQTPYWFTALQNGIIVLGILGVSFILWHTGLGTLIKKLIGFVPNAKQQEANLTVAALDHRSSVNFREVIAAKRASDSEFNVAYERAATKRNSKIRQDDRSSSRIGPVDTRSV